jgi:hypothetical protein
MDTDIMARLVTTGGGVAAMGVVADMAMDTITRMARSLIAVGVVAEGMAPVTKGTTKGTTMMATMSTGRAVAAAVMAESRGTARRKCRRWGER